MNKRANKTKIDHIKVVCVFTNALAQQHINNGTHNQQFSNFYERNLFLCWQTANTYHFRVWDALSPMHTIVLIILLYIVVVVGVYTLSLFGGRFKPSNMRVCGRVRNAMGFMNNSIQ